MLFPDFIILSEDIVTVERFDSLGLLQNLLQYFEPSTSVGFCPSLFVFGQIASIFHF